MFVIGKPMCAISLLGGQPCWPYARTVNDMVAVALCVKGAGP